MKTIKFYILLLISLALSTLAFTQTANMTADSVLTEYRLDYRTLGIKLTDETFKNFTGLLISDFTLVTHPSGLSIESITGISSDSAILALQFDGTDFDVNYLDFAVDIDSTVLDSTTTEYLRTGSLTIQAYVETPVATLTPDSALNELRLDYRSLTIDLSEEKFADYTTLNISNFTLVSGPAGLSIQSVTGISSTRAVINLQFNDTDFDANITNFMVDISSSVLVQTTTGSLSSSSLTIIAYVETPVATLTTDSALTEQHLDYRTLTIDLTEERFTDYTTLQPSDFTLVNKPTGLTIQTVTPVSPVKVQIALHFDGSDFDITINNFHVNIVSSVLYQTTSGNLSTSNLSIQAWVENPVATLTADSILTEYRIDARNLIINLTEEKFRNYLTLTPSNFTLLNYPTGLSIRSVTGISPTRAQIALQFNGNDFDADITNFRVDISYTVLVQTTSGSLNSTPMTIFAYVEAPGATLTFDSALTEYRLDYRTLTINLTEEKFKNYAGLQVADFILVNKPTGLSIQSVTGNSATQVTIALQFDGSDFDTDFPNFYISIPYTALIQTTTGVLSTSPLLIDAYMENPVATLTADSVLTEYRIDVRYLTINLSEEKFINYLTLTPSNFTLLNFPTGLSIQSVTGISPTKADIDLQFYGDFDVNYPGFYVAIPEAVLFQTTSGTLNTNTLNISSYVETPVATLVNDSVLTEKRLDFRKLTINLTEEEFHRDYTLLPAHFILNNKPAGLTVASVSRLTSKKAELDLQFDGTDFDATITNFSVSIVKDVLLQSKTTNLKTNDLIIWAYAENPACTITSDSVLAEHRLAARYLSISLTDDRFADYTTITPASFTLVNPPPGLSIEQVTGLGPKSARLDLAFTYIDFDTDYSSFRIIISKSILVQSTASDLISNSLTIKAFIEVPVASLSTDSLLTEYRIDSRTLTINLTQEEFSNYTTLVPAHFVLVNYPAGLSIQSVSGKSPTRAEIELQFNRTDFDSDILNFAVDISYSVLIQTKTGYLRSSQLPIFAYVEHPAAALSADSTLAERRLDYRTLTIDLAEEKFKNYTTLLPSNFTLVNKPTGLSIQSVTGISPVRANVALQFDGTDFDVNITNFRIDIAYTVLVQITSGVLSSSPMAINAYVETPQATLTSDSVLTERRLDYRSLTIDLTEEKFKNYLTLQTSDFVLVNKPAGLTVQSVTGNSPVKAQVTLQFDGTDYDTDYPDFYVNIPYTKLVQTTSGNLSSSELFIDSYTEIPVATLTADSNLTEQRLDYRTLTINLSDERFKNYTTLQVSDFTLINKPTGLSIQSITPLSSKKVNINLQFDGTDFDSDITDFYVTIPSTVLYQTTSGTLATSHMNIKAWAESPTATLTSDSVLTEQRLDHRVLTIDLNEEHFNNYATLTVSDFTLVNNPTGLSIQSVTGLSPKRARIELQFDGTDFETNILTFYVSIASSVLYQTTSGTLATSQLSIFALTENPVAILTADSVLTEKRLDFRTLTINLTEEEFLESTTLQVSHFTLVNSPAGLSIQSVTKISHVKASLDLKFIYTDFDVNYPDFHIDISSLVLKQTTSGSLGSSQLNIQAYVEQPVATLTADSVLTERRLDARVLTLNLTEEEFLNWGTLLVSDFTLANAPAGLSVQSVTGISRTRVNLALQFIYTDFDVNYPDFRVNIASTVLLQTKSGALSSTKLNILAMVENPLATLTADSVLTERRLDWRKLIIDLTEEEFHKDSILLPRHFILNNKPVGLTVGSVFKLTPRKAELDLQFDGTDFDATITNFSVSILKNVLIQSKITNLQSTTLTILAYAESPACTITPDSVLTEQRLDVRSLMINLYDERFLDYQAIIPANFTLVNPPPGLYIQQVTGLGPRTARMDLAFTYNDFDTDYSSFRIIISRSILFQSKTSDLTSNSLTIKAFVETPVAALSADSILTEYRIGARTLTIHLTQELFRNYTALMPANFILANNPTGLSIQSVTGISPTQAEIELQFNGADFDVNILNFAVDINYNVLIQTKTGYLRTSQLPIYAYVEHPVATLSADSALSELRLDWRILTVDLSEEKFKNYSTLLPSNFTLVNKPAGLTIQSVTGISPVRVNIALQFDGTDFDANITNFRVDIAYSVLVQTISGVLNSSQLGITAFVETPQATLTSDSILTERRLDYRTLTLSLREERFKNYTTLQTSDFILVNKPAGLTVQSVTGISAVRAQVALQFNGTDYDTDYPNFYVNIPYTALVQKTTGYLSSSQLNIDSYLENPVATLTADSLLTEQRLDYRTLTIDLSDEKFKNYTTLQASNFTLVNKPAGLSIQSITPVSSKRVRIALLFDGTDFDTDISSFYVTIPSTVLVQTTSGNLATNQMNIDAWTENPSATLTADSVLTEQRLDYRVLTIDLNEERFINYTTLNATNFALVNFPTGLSIQSVTGLSPRRARIELQFNGTDFATNILNFLVNITSSVLYQTTTGSLSSSQLIIFAYSESPVAILTADSVLTEKRLDSRTLTINLSEEEFKNYTTLQVSNFTLVNAPTGLSVQSVTGISPTKATIDLRFIYTDFDANIPNFHVDINSSVLHYTPSGYLSSSQLNIQAYVEHPVATLTADSVLTEKRLDARLLTINLTEDEFINYAGLQVSNFTLVNAPAGLTIQSVTGISKTKVGLDLQFTYTDFDVNYTNFRVDIASSVLLQTKSGVLSSTQLNILAYVEQPVATLTADSVLTERRLNVRMLTLNLSDEEFIDYHSLQTTHFTLVNAPTGLTLQSVTGVSKRQAILDLQFDGTDFDVSITNFYIRISKSILIQSKVSDLQSNTLIVLAYVEQPVAIMTADSALTEYRLDYRALTINLTEETFINYTALGISDFTLNNKPTGLSVQSVQGISPTRVILNLTFTYNDFDADINVFSVSIDKSKLLQSATNLTTNTLKIFAYMEVPVLLATPDSILHELTLARRSLNLKLTDEKFLDFTTLGLSSFYLLNAPSGLVLESISGTNPVTAVLNLNYTGNDFDANITSLRVGISKNILLQSKTSDLLSNNLTINCYIENPACTITGDSVLHELTLGRRYVILNLVEEKFSNYLTIAPANFLLINNPVGLTIESVSGISPRTARIYLDFDKTDFDANYLSFTVDISSSVLIQTKTGYLRTSLLPIYAYVEHPVATLSADSVLSELRLDWRTLTIDLTEEKFKNYSTLMISNFTLVNKPTGLSMQSVTGISPVRANIALQFNGTDFDANITNFRVNIANSVLVQTTAGVLSSSPLGITAFVETPQATLTSDSVLTERRIDFRTLTINLGEEKFKNYTILQPSDFILVNKPVGLSVESVTGISATSARVALQFDGTDYDTDYPNFYVNIPYTALIQKTSGYLSSSQLNIDSYTENPVATLTADSLLTEQRLDYRTLTIDLSDEKFKNYTTLQASNFTLVNKPTGLSIQSITPVSYKRVRIALQFDGTDFDTDISNFYVTIPSTVLFQTTSGSLATNQVNIKAWAENPSATLTADSVLTEHRLDSRVLTIDLNEERFINYTTLNTTNFTLVNFPSGLTIQSVTGLSPRRARIELQFNGTDFGSNILDFHVNIASSVLFQTTAGSLSTSQLIIFAYSENPVAVLTADSVLTEKRLDARELTIYLAEDYFENPATLAVSDFTLVNKPAGLSIQSVTGISSVKATLNLAFVYTDFDTSIPNFHVDINSSVLHYTTSGSLSSSQLNIQAYVEHPVATLTADSILTERRLDTRVLTINLTEDEFINYTALQASNFTLVNAPAGLSLQSVTGISRTRVRMDLQFTYTDFDLNYPNFRVDISNAVLLQTNTGVLSSNQMNILAYVENPVVTLTADSVLTERRLNTRLLTLNLTDEEFIDYLALQKTSFTLVNAPAGLSIQSVTGESKRQAILDLQFDGTDFDVSVTNFYVRISKNILVQSKVSDLQSNALTILAYVELPLAIMTEDSTLTEYRLDYRSLTINLTDESFINYTSLAIADFTLNNKPTGLTIQSVQGISPTRVILNLAFVYNDFDADINIFSVTINKSKLLQSATNLTSNTLKILAYLEVPVLLATPDSIMHEYTLTRRNLGLKLTDDKFLDYTSLAISNFYLVNAPAGLVIESVSGSNPTTATMALGYGGADFDTDIPDLKVVISKNILLQSKSSDLLSNNLMVYSYVEHPVSTITADSVLHELTLGRRYLDLTLTEEKFINYLTIAPANFQLMNAPSGLTIESVSGISKTHARIYLNFNRTDFDAAYPDFAVRISKSILFQSTVSDLTSNSIPISTRVEVPSAVITPDSALYEYRLNFRTLDLKLTDERFINQASVIPSRFTFINAPVGVSIENINYLGEQRIIIALAFNGTDFDDNITNFSVSISKNILVQSSVDLNTNGLTIPANIEPVIQSVIIPDKTMKVGDQVIATIKVENDQGFTYTLKSGTIGGFPLTSLFKVNSTTYTAVFTITENGNDYLKNENIPVTNLRFYNDKIPGIIYNQPIIQGNDLLDANTPAIIQVSAITSGARRIGNTVILLLTADEPGYIFDNTSSINNVSFSPPTIVVNDLGTGNYNIVYTIQEGNQNVASGNLAIRVILSDSAGNVASPYTLLNPNDISIDANRPVISRAYVSSSDQNINVGEKVDITVLADQPDYTVSSVTRVNGVYETEANLNFINAGYNTYRFEYTVEADEGSVTTGNLTIYIVLVDSYGNESFAFTTLDPNNVAIYTSRPSAAISGTTGICISDSARLTISFGGIPPWEVELSDGSSTRIISNIQEASYQFYVDPDSNTTYTVPKVTDGTANTNTGIGSAIITLNLLPEVEIINLLESYDVDIEYRIPLEGIPSGGIFAGSGVSFINPSYYFIPYFASMTDPPHRIIYTYANPNGCIGRDTAVVNLIKASGSINFERPVACFNDESFLITGSNAANSPGLFTISPSVTGVIENSENNQAILNPSLLYLTETITATITYTYLDTSGLLLNIERSLKIEKLENARITPMADIQFCSNEKSVAVYGNYSTRGIFSGNGVTGNVTKGFKFNPALAEKGLNRILYTYQSDNLCMVADSIGLLNYGIPLAQFSVESNCIMNTGGTFQFINESDTSGGEENSWSWNFGDLISGPNNFSTLKDPTHFYSKPEQKSILLIVSNEMGCSDSATNTIVLSPNPDADFSWSGQCLTSDAIVFDGTEKLFADDFVSIREWKFYDADGNLADLFSAEQVLYNFESPEVYNVGYKVVTNYGCSDSIEKQITLIPTYNIADESYYQNFETIPEGWASSPLSAGGQNSWNLSVISSAKFPYSASSDSTAWYTKLPKPELVENSAVYTPCFNFENVTRPLIMLDIRRSMDPDREGAVVQYTSDQGKSWKNIGTVNNGGLNWYNSSRITNGPAGQSIGWTGTASASEDPDWITTAHHLDDLINKKEIRFRIVYGSRGDNTIRNEGFAFDNFHIGQRTKVAVMEYFTNANEFASVNPDRLVNTLANNLYKDVFDIQYHTNYPSPDRMYQDNPTPSSARGLYYGISAIPYALIDGGGFDAVLNHERNYDFGDRSPDSTDILIRSLLAPNFNILLTINQLSPVIQVTVNIEALNDIPKKELTLHTVVLEVKIDDPIYTGANGVTEFESVARMMLPDVGGTTFNKAWAKGESEQVIITWNEPFEYLNEDNIALVVFLQDYTSKEILQAAGYSAEEHITSSRDIRGSDPAVSIYPNPAKDRVTIDLGRLPEKPVILRMFDVSGKCVLEKQIPPLQKETVLDLKDVKHGMYIVEIREKGSYEVTYGKVVVF